MAQRKPEGDPEGSLIVKIADCEPNPWNPNKMDAFTYAKVIESLTTYGFIDPLTIRPHPNWKRAPTGHQVVLTQTSAP